MNNIYCIYEESTIRDAMEKIDKNLIGAVFVVSKTNKVLGIVTDGIIRRAILKDFILSDKITKIYSDEFKSVSKFVSKKKAKDIMLKYRIRQIPILGDDNSFEGIYFLDDIIKHDIKKNYVFILAGGLGTRLRPLTEILPKPMLELGGKPILLRIIESFKEYGFINFIISLNYKGEIIEEYFGNGKNFGVNIEYVKESRKLGTAGSIDLAREKLVDDFIVINGDIITGVDYENMLEHHQKSNNKITVGTRLYEYKIPYGVLVTDEISISSLEEKPTYCYNVNAGIYALKPEVIKNIPCNEEYNMTQLIESVIQEDGKCGVYNITEYWADIGQMDDFKRANEEVNRFF